MGLSMQPQRGGFIFGGNTGVGPEELRRRRQIAEALMAQQVRPQTAWDGLGNAARSIAGALMARSANKEEAAGRQAAQERFASLFSPQSPQAMPAPAAAPVPQAAPAQPDREAVIQALIAQESGGRPDARSPKGAMGLMQIMPQTARDPGFGLPNIFEVGRSQGFNVPDESDATLNALLADPKVNEAFGTAYFGKMQDRYGGDMDKALAAYNAGPGAVDKFGGVPPYQETQDYVRDINARLGRGAGPAQAGPQPAPAAAPGGGNAGPQGVDAIPTEALMAAYSDPYLAPEQRQIVGMMLEQRLAKPEGMTPYQQAQLDLRRQELEAKNNRGGFRMASPEEAARYGAPAGQFGPDGRFYPVNPPSGMAIESDGQGGVRVVQGPGVANRPFTEAQSKDNVFATRAQGALEAFEPYADALTSFGQRVAGSDPTGVVRGQVQTPEFQMAEQAGNEFLQAILRKDTGAAITAQEQELYGKTYLPQPGDGPEVLAMKRAARQRALDALKAGMSPAQMIAQERALRREGQGVTVPQGGGGVTVPQEQPQPAPQPNGGRDRPQRGQVIDGYRFLGGDPADPNSWEKL